MTYTKLFKSFIVAAALLFLPGHGMMAQLHDVSVRLTRYVNPYIGTGGHGHVFLGANVPFGLSLIHI